MSTHNPQDPQLLLSHYASVRKHPKEVFTSRHEHPFLLYTATEAVRDSGFTTASGLHSIEIVRTEGTPAGAIGQKLMVVEAKKSTRNPFPDQVYVGRAENNDIIFEHASVTKSHAYLKLVDGVWSLFDMESSNGCKVGSTRVAPYVGAKISDQDSVTFGDVVCQWMRPGAFYDFVVLQLAGT